MDIHERLIPVLRNINFAYRYNEICKKHCDFDNSLNEYDIGVIKDLIENAALKVSFVKSEKFYKIIENVGDLTIQFNIIPRRGFLQFVWDVTKGKERLNLGWGMWESITRELEKIEVKKPLFSSLDELKEILGEILSIYEDFKRELLKMEGSQI